MTRWHPVEDRLVGRADDVDAARVGRRYPGAVDIVAAHSAILAYHPEPKNRWLAPPAHAPVVERSRHARTNRANRRDGSCCATFRTASPSPSSAWPACSAPARRHWRSHGRALPCPCDPGVSCPTRGTAPGTATPVASAIRGSGSDRPAKIHLPRRYMITWSFRCPPGKRGTFWLDTASPSGPGRTEQRASGPRRSGTWRPRSGDTARDLYVVSDCAWSARLIPPDRDRFARTESDWHARAATPAPWRPARAEEAPRAQQAQEAEAQAPQAQEAQAQEAPAREAAQEERARQEPSRRLGLIAALTPITLDPSRTR